MVRRIFLTHVQQFQTQKEEPKISVLSVEVSIHSEINIRAQYATSQLFRALESGATFSSTTAITVVNYDGSVERYRAGRC